MESGLLGRGGVYLLYGISEELDTGEGMGEITCGEDLVSSMLVELAVIHLCLRTFCYH